MERIISYENEKDILKIINKNFKNKYFFVRHDSNHKKLFFKNELPTGEGK